MKDIDDEEYVHDQLPTLEDIHGKSNQELINLGSFTEIQKKQSRKKCTYVSVVFLVVLIVVSLSVILVVGSNDSHSTRSKSTGKGNDDEEVKKPVDKQRNEYALEFLLNITTKEDLGKAGSAQQLAFDWIINADELQVEIPKSMEDENAGKFVSRYVLAVLYYALDGLNWRNRFDFLSATDECSWNSLVMTSKVNLIWHGYQCDQKGQPYAVMLPRNNLKGSLPKEIGFLSSLKILSIYDNAIESPLPSEIQDIKTLELLDLRKNNLKEEFPATINSLLNLKRLFLSFNDFRSSSVPDGLGSLTELSHLHMLSCNMTGLIPNSLENLSRLEYIDMAYNRFSGPLPPWLGNSPNLDTLILSNNDFSSSIPESLSNASNLTHLLLDDNDLNGDLSVIESLSNLEALFVEDNKFEQTLDSSFLASLDKLQIIDASNNKLKGQLPLHLFEMKELQILDLHGNELDGNLPDFTLNTKLDYLLLHENNFAGEIPASISNLKNLTHLDLSTNAFTGPIPPSLGNMVSLTYLFIAKNNFDEGVFPENIKKLTNLKELSLKETRRNGPIPDWIGNLKDLIFLDLDKNEFNGQIPASMGDLRKLFFLLLNNNKLTGDVPGRLHSLPYLMMMLLDNNSITALESVDDQYEFCERTAFLGKVGSVFTADCEGPNPELACPCCTKCCKDGEQCDNGSDFLANHDIVWEHGYDRSRWIFNNETMYVLV